ncbi:sugar ABC transporter ATP-binding protein [Salinisphaera sp.]|uniref:sugar ABC transporter ATP-binding protein n=1 Tax=Salinisphaera sp. TaxID=1914330 RepID=UPI002D7980F2|nr:sugar ABC transporter ATP-binding protein [Salinisphaera sp.]HET7315039.1 sugar ABC transporter ATP-binding protein [Salinisphaera sp.]
MSTLLEIDSIAKRFGATQALDGVSFSVEKGEIRALLGENGAGKSTCVKVLNGIETPDSGSIRFDGEAYTPGRLSDAHIRGVSTAFQELSLMPDLSVAVNLCMPLLPRNRLGLVSFGEIEKQARRMLERYDATDIDPRAKVASLAIADKQRLEIARAFARNPRLLILDEPTATLTDVSWLYRHIRRLIEDGGSVLFITHRLKEVRELCRRATVFRNGRVVDTVELDATPDSELFRLMIGRTVSESGKTRRSLGDETVRTREKPAIQVTGLQRGGFGPVDLTVQAGEIVGVAGLEGQGQRSLFMALAGTEAMTSKSFQVSGRNVSNTSSAKRRRKLGIAFVPEERKDEGLFPNMETQANVSISNVGLLSRFGMLFKSVEMDAIRDVTRAVALENRYFDISIENLSGGNQQKALIARALFSNAHCLLLFDPTRGVDVGTKEAIYESMRAQAANGIGTLFYSTELSELVSLCDRCLVIYDNRCVGECVGDEITEERLIELMHGAGGRTEHGS